MEKAVKAAEDKWIQERFKPKKKYTKRTAKQPSGFQCAFCGNYTDNAEKYYSSLTTLLTERFINLLIQNKGEDCTNLAIDYIHATFGSDNKIIREALRATGYLEKFEQRYGKGIQDLEYKLKCDYCDEWKWDHLITIDDTATARFICEDCLSNEREKEERERKK